MFEHIKEVVYVLYLIQFVFSLLVFSFLAKEGKIRGAHWLPASMAVFVAPFMLGILMCENTDIISRLLKKAKSKLDLYNFMKNKYNVTITDRMGNSVSLTPEQQAAANIAIVAALGK